MQCPSCQTELPKETRLCPNCGALVYGGMAQQQRPMNDDHAPGQFMPPISPYITKSKWGDIALGVVVSWMGSYASLIGVPVVFFLLRKKYRVFANTIGIMWALGLLIGIAYYFISSR
jgi:predicted amidophosphoribosyltransferase